MLLCVWAGWEGRVGGRWNNRSVRSLYCTQNNSAPQDSWGNNVPCHCVCNYSGEGMWSDWLVCQSCSPSSTTCLPFCTHTPQSQPLPSWHFLHALTVFSRNDVCASFLDDILMLAAHQTCLWLLCSHILLWTAMCCFGQCSKTYTDVLHWLSHSAWLERQLEFNIKLFISERSCLLFLTPSQKTSESN